MTRKNTNHETPASYIIVGKFGGLTKAANCLGHPITTVQGWLERGVIPQGHHLNIIQAGKDQDPQITIELLDFLQVPDEAA